MKHTRAESNGRRQPPWRKSALAAGLALMLGGYAAAKSSKDLARVKDPVLTNETRVSYKGPWTVVEDLSKDTIRIYDESGDLSNLINLAGKEHAGTVNSVDNAGNCLAHRYSGDALVLYYFDSQGQLKWEKTADLGQGAGFKLSPDGRHFVRGSGDFREFEIYATAAPQTKLEYGPKNFSPDAHYFADFAADNTLILFVLPGTLLKLDPATGTALAVVQLPNAKSNDFRRAYDTDFANQASDRNRTRFASILNHGPGRDIDLANMSILVYDQDLNSSLITTGSYIQDAAFVESMLAFTVYDRKRQTFQMRLSRDLKSAEIINHDASSDIGTVANEDGVLHFFWPAQKGEFRYDLASGKLVQGNKRAMGIFKRKPGRKDAKTLQVGK